VGQAVSLAKHHVGEAVMTKRFKGTYDRNKLTAVSVRQLRVFMKYIAKRDLWDDMEQALYKNGIDQILISVHPIQIAQDKIRKTLKDGKNRSGWRISASPHKVVDTVPDRA
jgi:site-specific recombinase XerD